MPKSKNDTPIYIAAAVVSAAGAIGAGYYLWKKGSGGGGGNPPPPPTIGNITISSDPATGPVPLNVLILGVVTDPNGVIIPNPLNLYLFIDGQRVVASPSVAGDGSYQFSYQFTTAGTHSVFVSGTTTGATENSVIIQVMVLGVASYVSVVDNLSGAQITSATVTFGGVAGTLITTGPYTGLYSVQLAQTGITAILTVSASGYTTSTQSVTLYAAGITGVPLTPSGAGSQPLLLVANGTINQASQPLTVTNTSPDSVAFYILDQPSNATGTHFYTIQGNSSESIDPALGIPLTEVIAQLVAINTTTGTALSPVLQVTLPVTTGPPLQIQANGTITLSSVPILVTNTGTVGVEYCVVDQTNGLSSTSSGATQWYIAGGTQQSIDAGSLASSVADQFVITQYLEQTGCTGIIISNVLTFPSPGLVLSLSANGTITGSSQPLSVTNTSASPVTYWVAFNNGTSSFGTGGYWTVGAGATQNINPNYFSLPTGTIQITLQEYSNGNFTNVVLSNTLSVVAVSA